MSFKKSLCCLLSAVLMFTSCMPKVGEAPPESGQQKMNNTQCLSGLPLVIEAFVAGEATETAVKSAWECASTAIKTFKKYVYGRADDRFEATELADFLTKNFLEASSPAITPVLREEMMRIKQLFLGGTLEYVTRAELDKILIILETFQAISLQMNPYMKLIAQKWTIAGSAHLQNDIRYFEKASEEIQRAAQSLANLIIENNQSYELDHFVTFLREFSSFTGRGWSVANEVERDMPLIKKIKKAISGGAPHSIGPADWKSFVLLGARGYLQYLRYYYFIKSAAEMGSSIRLGYLARSLEDLLEAFQELVAQKPKDPACGSANTSCISKQEISGILNAFSDIWKEFHVSDKLIDEVMKLKKIYFGGREGTITSLDFERGKNKVGGLKLVVEKFLPYFQVYSFEWDRSHFDNASAERFFEEARLSLEASGESLGTLLESSYDLENLAGFLDEVARLYPIQERDKENGVHPALAMKKFVPLVKEMKKILFSEDNAVIKKEQWSPLFKYSANFYSTYLFHDYFFKQEVYGTVSFIRPFKKLTDQVLKIMDDMIKFKTDHIIRAGEIHNLAKELVSAELLPKGLAPESLDELIKVVLNRIIWPAKSRLEGIVPNGLISESIESLRLEINLWYETERYLYSLTASPLKPLDLQTRVLKTLKEPNLSGALRAGLNEVSLMLKEGVPQPVDAESRLIITNVGKLSYDERSASRLNLSRLLGRIFIQAATTDLVRLGNNEGVDLKEAQTLFDLIKPAVVEMGLLEEDNTSFIESRFREANIFSAHSNGDQLVNFQEMTDIVGMILSGITLNNMFRKDILAACDDPARMQKEIYVHENCLRKIYLEKTSLYMTATPEYLKYFRIIDPERYARFLGDVLKAAGHVPNEEGMVKLLDADLVPHVFQYLEMTIAKFDTNKSTIIDLDEAIVAYPSFKGILTELTKDQSLIKKEDLLALFTYILHYGKPPDVFDYPFKWLPWKSDRNSWEVSADRKQLARILGYIADQMAKSKAQRPVLISKEDEEAIRKSQIYKAKD